MVFDPFGQAVPGTGDNQKKRAFLVGNRPGHVHFLAKAGPLQRTIHQLLSPCKQTAQEILRPSHA
jgi:transposase